MASSEAGERTVMISRQRDYVEEENGEKGFRGEGTIEGEGH